MTTLITCKEGWEKTLASEAALYQATVQTSGRGWILAETAGQDFLVEFCFANNFLENPTKLSAGSVNNFAEQLATLFLTHIKDTRIVEPWPFIFTSSGDEQLIHRANIVEKNWLEKIQKKVSRVAKLAQKSIPHDTKFTDGFFVHFIDFEQAFVSFKAASSGQQRMQMDPQAPSRSYLKLEEAFRIFGCAPQEKQTVIDLGAAPGGWSYSALKRGAKVTAIDNGPLKGAVKGHALVTHLTEDALKYKHERTTPADWLLCDILEEPDIILELLHKWLGQKWCRYFVANLKIGRANPIAVLKKIRDPQNGLASHCRQLIIRQLYHDREEITLMGEING